MRTNIDELLEILDVSKNELLKLYPDIQQQIQIYNIVKIIHLMVIISTIGLFIYYFIVDHRYSKLRQRYRLDIYGDFKYVIPYEIVNDENLLNSIKSNVIQYQFQSRLIMKIIRIAIVTALGLKIFQAFGSPGVIFILDLP